MGNNEESTFRDRPINIDKTGKRQWIYARQPKGSWYTRRRFFALFLLSVLAFAPFISVDGHPFMLLDIANRRFYILGLSIYAQDTYIMALVMASVVVFVVLFTVVFGRLWCGWACPQTVFLEMVYRRIEYLFEGNYRSGKKPASTLRTIAKHMTYFVVTVIIANLMLNWFIGPKVLFRIMAEPVSEHLVGFLFLIAISGAYYFIYAFFREQICTMVCPYGRLQSVLTDSKTIMVTYDYKRGEPRGSKQSGQCINCNRCVSVCPTGIDIKNGTQLECTNCTACIDECNDVMKKLKRPPNLIRYTSVSGIETGKNSIKSARTYAYSAVLLVLLAILSVVLIERTPIDTTVLRVPGTMFQMATADTVSNMYRTKIINKTHVGHHLQIRIPDAPFANVELISGKEYRNNFV